MLRSNNDEWLFWLKLGLFSLQASEQTLAWEEEFLALLERLKIELEDNSFKMYYSAGRR